MSGHEKDRQERPEQALSALLAAYAAGTASPEERAEVESRLRSDPTLAGRLSLTLATRDAARQLEASSQDDWTPGELGYRRLSREIDREIDQRGADWTGRIAEWSDSVAVWRGVAAAAVVALAVFAALPQAKRPPPGVYAPASGGSTLILAQIAFAPAATEAEIRRLLIDTGATLVDGPSALGLYRVAFVDLNAREAALKTMRQSKIIETVSAE